MAIKVALVAALLVGLVALASATSYTTTVITTSYDEEGGQRSQQCRQQVQGRQFQSCQSYLTQRRSSPYEDEAEIDVEANPQRQQRESVEECCQQLRQMDRNQCGCEAIQHAVRQAQQSGSRGYQTGRESQSEQIYQKARQLPRVCGLRQQQCRFNIVLA